jgi:hypothetical protein
VALGWGLWEGPARFFVRTTVLDSPLAAIKTGRLTVDGICPISVSGAGVRRQNTAGLGLVSNL